MENDDLINGKARWLKETVWRTLVMVRDPQIISWNSQRRQRDVMGMSGCQQVTGASWWESQVNSEVHRSLLSAQTLAGEPVTRDTLWKNSGAFGEMFCDGRLKSPDLSLIQLVFWQKAQRHLLFKILISMLHFKGNNLIYLILKCQEHHCQSN